MRSRDDRERLGAQMDTLIGTVLLVGVATSLFLVTAGMLWHWATTGSGRLDYPIGGTNLLDFVLGDVRTLARGAVRPRALVNLGIAVLLLTPYLRVLASVLYFGIAERDWRYTLITACVLGTLTWSLVLR
jgi:uncharacterized membrane protein